MSHSTKRLLQVINHLKKARLICGICSSYDDVECEANGPRLKTALSHVVEANRILNELHQTIVTESN